MPDNPLFEPQPRSAELFFGIAALIAGICGLTTCTWLYLRYSASQPRSVPVFAVGGLVSLYSLVLASRLLRRHAERRYLVSHWTLMVMGILLAFAAIVPALGLGDWRLLGDFGLAAAAVSLGWRRLRKRDAA